MEMAFRTETAVGAILILCAAVAPGATYEARHKHLRNGAPGTLRIGDNSIAWEERAQNHSREWRYEDIQQLVLSPETLRIVTYNGQRRELGRDEVYLFDKLPPSLAAEWYPKFREKLDRRFVAALADERVVPEWQIPVKLLHGRLGSQGVVLVAKHGVVYKTGTAGESRTWRIHDIENVSSSDAFDLTITTHERDFRFQLKQELSESRYNELWREVNQSNGLEILTHR
jgi:hypothetical protein